MFTTIASTITKYVTNLFYSTDFEVPSEGGYKDHKATVESFDPEANHFLSSENATPFTWFQHRPLLLKNQNWDMRQDINEIL